MVSKTTWRAGRLRHRFSASRGEGGEIVLVGHRRQAAEHVAQIRELNVKTPAGAVLEILLTRRGGDLRTAAD